MLQKTLTSQLTSLYNLGPKHIKPGKNTKKPKKVALKNLRPYFYKYFSNLCNPVSINNMFNLKRLSIRSLSRLKKQNSFGQNSLKPKQKQKYTKSRNYEQHK